MYYRQMPFARLARVAALLLVLGGAPALAQQHLLLDGGRLIDGTGRTPVADVQILITANRIARVGPRGSFEVPGGAERIDTTGKTLLPGFVDLHFHIADDPTLVPLFLANGITSARDPGAWMELFEPVKRWQDENHIPGPRLFLCGPHLDGPNPAYPTDSVVMLSPEEARLWVRREVRRGATAIKVYFRLPLESIRAAAEEAHRLRVPVTAHLEIINVRDAVEAGIDGVEHITSLGLSLLAPMQAEKYRQQVLADNNARREGRYQMWASIDPHSEQAAELARFLAARKVFVDPNLAVFERRPDPDDENSAAKVLATKHMKEYVGVLHRAGVPIVAGSHSNVDYAPRGFAFHRELETLVETGLTPAETLVAATRTGAQFLGREHELGTVEEGKLADILVLDNDPLVDISNTRSISKIILDGRVLDPKKIPPLPRP
jgi:imidazolonepropionase-like amidohydrolase